MAAITHSGININVENDEFSRKLGGYLPRHSFVLIEGSPGLGKSVIAQRLAYGAVKNKIKTSYISTELSVSSFVNQMVALSYDVREELLNQTLKFVSLYSDMYHVSMHDEILPQILGKKEIIESDVIIFDSLDDLLFDKNASASDVFEFVSFLRKLIGSQKTIIFCIDKEKVNVLLHERIKNMAEVYFYLYEKQIYDNTAKVLKVLRFQGAKSDFEEELAFKVRPGMGVIIDISS
jgi:archaeal flagellar protein FlaH